VINPLDIVTHPFADRLIRSKARKLARRPSFQRCEEEDLRQALLLQLLSVARLFDPSRGSAEAFIVTAVRSGFDMLVRERRALKRSGHPRSLEAEILDETGRGSTLSQRVEARDLYRRLGSSVPDPFARIEAREEADALMGCLEPGQRQLVRLIADHAVAGAARSLQISRRQLLVRLNAVRARIARSRARARTAA